MTFEEYISGMSVRDMVTHLLCPAIRSTYKKDSDPREYFDWIFSDKSIKPGSVFFFPSEKADIIAMSHKLKDYLGSMPLIAMDMETSPSCITGCTSFGSAMAISAANSLEDAYICGEGCAKTGLECGVSWAFGPVADLNINPSNPIVNIRSWGDDANRTVDFVSACVKGMEENGFIATGKHFPGDGMDDRDQHLCTTVNSLSKEDWMATYGKVWKKLIDDGIRSIMPGHIGLPAFEKNNEIVPATISYTLITELLRGELGFDGLVVTDGMNMGGLSPIVTPAEGIIKMVQAGCDVLLFPNFWADMTFVADTLENAVNDGTISIERIKESIYRIWREKKRLGILDGENGMLFKPCSDEDNAKFKETASRIAKNAISIYKNEKGVLPLDEKKIKKVISVDVTNYERPMNNKLDTAMKEKGIEIMKYGVHTEGGIVSVMELPEADAIILNFYYGPMWASNHIKPNGIMLQRIYEYVFKPEIPVIMVCHGSPYIPSTFPYVKTVVNTYSFVDVDADAMYDVIFGKREAKGVCPVKLP